MEGYGDWTNVHDVNGVAKYSYVNLHGEILHVDVHVNEPYYEPADWQANPHGGWIDVLGDQSPDTLDPDINHIAEHSNGNPGALPSNNDISEADSRDLHPNPNLQVRERCNQGEGECPPFQPFKGTAPYPLLSSI